MMLLRALGVIAAIVALAVIGNLYWPSATEHTEISIGDQTFSLELARTPAQQRRGLMERTDLAPCGGMVFLFENQRPLSFWMRNTPTPLWMAFVNDSGEIVRLIRRAAPLNDTPLDSFAPANMVIEIEADCPKLTALSESAHVTRTTQVAP